MLPNALVLMILDFWAIGKHDVAAAKSKIEQVALQLEERRKAKVRKPELIIGGAHATQLSNRRRVNHWKRVKNVKKIKRNTAKKQRNEKKKVRKRNANANRHPPAPCPIRTRRLAHLCLPIRGNLHHRPVPREVKRRESEKMMTDNYAA